jgi:hypothetical protein
VNQLSGYRDTAAQDELEHLLAVGPFPAALRAAIQASGLGLDRIRYRLRTRGTPVSAATLSFWQSGRHQPERASSLEALTNLEEVLGLPGRALSTLLGPPRPRGRRLTDPGLLQLADVYRNEHCVVDVLAQFDTRWADGLARLSHHDHLRIGPDGLVRSLSSSTVMRATTDGPDRAVAVYSGEGTNAPEILPVRGCTLGKVVADPCSGTSAAELLFGHPLRHGEILVMEYTVNFPAPYPPDRFWEARFNTAIRVYAVEVEFARPMVPRRCVRYTGASTDPTIETETIVPVDEYDRVSVVATDVSPSRIGLRWDF